MGELFKSALEYFSTPNNGQEDNNFVGQIVEISNIKLRIQKVIAEGGFAIVYAAEDVATGKIYALKRILAADQEHKDNVIKETFVLRKLCGHPNIIQYMSLLVIEQNLVLQGQTEYLILTEFCGGGSLMDILKNRIEALQCDIITKLTYQISKAVAYMHSQSPAIIHRDLKIENVLLTQDGFAKLCDFGSATVEVFQPDITWSANQRQTLEENLAQFTTPMYRAPEMIDTWNNYYIGPPIDVWALGCILYTLCYMRHPFEDGAKLRIINANYTFPSDQKYVCFHRLIRDMLKINPEERITIGDVLEQISVIAEMGGYNLNEPLDIKNFICSAEINLNKVDMNEMNDGCKPLQPPRPPPAVVQKAPLPKQADSKQASPGLLSSIKGGAGSFFRNLKGTSTRVMQTVQQSIARSDLDITYITSRILIMPLPSEGLESAYRANHIEDVKLFLESRDPNLKFSIYNLSGRPYQMRSQQVKILDCSFAYPQHFKAPLLNSLYQLCEDMYQNLRGDSRNVCAINCMDGKSSSATVFCALLLYVGVFKLFEDALQLFAVKRMPPNLQPSEIRCLYYMTEILRSPVTHPHYKPITLISLQMQPIPLFTKVRDGCRPYIEVYSENRCVLSTMQEYDKMRLYNINEGKCLLPINASICGDVCVIVYHARNILGGVMSQGKATGIRICQMQFHTGFISEEETSLQFPKSELDDLAEGNDHYQDRFTATINVFVSDTERPPSQPAPWKKDQTKRTSNVLFSSALEMEEIIDNFASKSSARSSIERKGPPRPKPPPPRPRMPVNICENKDIHIDAEHQAKKEEAVDLLNLNSMPPITEPICKSPSSNFDLLSDLGSNPVFFESYNAVKSETLTNDLLFDPFGPGGPVIQKSDNEEESSTVIKAEEEKSIHINSSRSGGTNGSNSFQDKVPSTSPLHQAKSPLNLRPDYSRSNFDTLNKGEQKNEMKGSKSTTEDIFGDLLGSQGYQFANKKDNFPRTINEMRKEELIKEIDPDKLKVMEWVEGKKGNIRALLCSVHTVLWEDTKWNKCEMHHLVTAADVKRQYRKACLAVHPDKQVGTTNEEIAKLVFMELNNAWGEFESDISQQNIFAS